MRGTRFAHIVDASKVDMALYYIVTVNPPKSVRFNRKISLHFDVEKVSMKHLTSGQDNLHLSGSHANVGVEINNMSKTYKPPGFHQIVTLAREVTEKDAQRQKLVLIPGFKLTWYYTGEQVEPEAEYTDPKIHMNPYFTR